jgi:hypothetical protein
MDLRAEQERDVDPPRVPAELSRLPWDLAKDEMGVKAVDFIAAIAKVFLRLAKDEMKTQVVAGTKEIAKVLGGAPKDEMLGVAGCGVTGEERPAPYGSGAPAP